MRPNVKMTGPPTFAAEPPPAVVGPCRLTCCTERTVPDCHDAASATGAEGAAHSSLHRCDACVPAHRPVAVHPQRNWWTRSGATARPACLGRHRWSAHGRNPREATTAACHRFACPDLGQGETNCRHRAPGSRGSSFACGTTCQSTRTHNSRRRLRRKVLWSGHFHVRPHETHKRGC